MPTITVDFQQETAHRIDQAQIEQSVQLALTKLPKRDWSLWIRLIGDQEMQRLNREHMRKDYPTDVLSFPVFNFDQGQPPALPDGPLGLGTVIVNLDEAERQTKKTRQDLTSEVQSLIAHGIGHLLGFHHE